MRTIGPGLSAGLRALKMLPQEALTIFLVHPFNLVNILTTLDDIVVELVPEGGGSKPGARELCDGRLVESPKHAVGGVKQQGGSNGHNQFGCELHGARCPSDLMT